MEVTSEQKKTISIILGSTLVVITAVSLLQFFRAFGLTQAVPREFGVVVGGRLRSGVITGGEHTLEFRALNKRGKAVNADVTFAATENNPIRYPINLPVRP